MIKGTLVSACAYNIKIYSNKTTTYLEVKLRAEHQETIAAGQSLPHGPELETIDPSYVGRSVIINKTKGDRKPFNPDA